MVATRKLIYNPPDTDINFIYQDDDIIVVDKPTGILSVPGRPAEHKDSLTTRVQDIFPEALVIHRLDLETSGIIIFARHKAAQKHIGQQFEKRTPQKTYIANVWDIPDKDNGTIDLPLICDWPNRPRQIVDYDVGKPCLTHWSKMGDGKFGSRIRLKPVTGRTHQLRVHMKEIGHPILGDSLYAHDDAFAATDRLHLHAQDITLLHPSTEKEIRFETKCPF